MKIQVLHEIQVKLASQYWSRIRIDIYMNIHEKVPHTDWYADGEA